MPTPKQCQQFDKYLAGFEHQPTEALTKKETVRALEAAGRILGFTTRSANDGGELPTPYVRRGKRVRGRIDVTWLRDGVPVATFEVEGYWCTDDSVVNDLAKFRDAARKGSQFHRIVLYRLAPHTGCPACVPWHRQEALRTTAGLGLLAQLVPPNRKRIEGVVVANNVGLGAKILLDQELAAMFGALPTL